MEFRVRLTLNHKPLFFKMTWHLYTCWCLNGFLLDFKISPHSPFFAGAFAHWIIQSWLQTSLSDRQGGGVGPRTAPSVTLGPCPYLLHASPVLTPVSEKYTFYKLFLMLFPVAFVLCPQRQWRDKTEQGQRTCLAPRRNCNSSWHLCFWESWGCQRGASPGRPVGILVLLPLGIKAFSSPHKVLCSQPARLKLDFGEIPWL